MSQQEQVFNNILISEFEEAAKEQYVKVSDGSEIRILTTKALKGEVNGYTLLLIPGWGTVVPGWEEVLMEAINDFDILYIESREKMSFRPGQGKIKNDIERLALDVREIIEYLEIDQNKMVTLTSSFSTLTIANLLGSKKIKPALSVLIGPVFQFNMPSATRYVTHIVPLFLVSMTKPIWRWWVKKFKSEDPVQAAKYIRSLDEADFKKWKAVAKRVCFTKVWDLYRQIEDNYVVVIGMETDKMHTIKQSKDITAAIPNAEYIDMGTNRATHSAEMIKVIRELMKKIS
ncbi:MAG: hypothetical protein KAU62_07970 [Candidatus Heimdallarchaeota archaeon]|nr:hypothetical protein [Candidatus Heimdallarchaeota archaeon]MCG3256007.1 hypothetical protein [Candidatus Heimdallarchaeota archaeon]MCK4611077.1 hypothetical protein [Candidatus Heimdallarchaeota archaeon]